MDGKNTEINYKDDKWCCSANCSKDGDSVNCNGTALSLKQQCKYKNKLDSPCNFYPTDEERNLFTSRSYSDVCEDNRYDLKTLYKFQVIS